MAEATDAPRSWAFMDPWWQVLKAHSLSGDSANGAIGGLAVSYRNNIGLQSRALRDALELVFLLSVVDRGAFVEGLVNHVSDGSKQYLEQRLPEDFPCHVEIRQNSRDPTARTWLRSVILFFAKPEPLRERDQDFRDARQQLLDAVDEECVYSKLRITVDLNVLDWRLATREVAKLVRTAPPPAADSPFRTFVLKIYVPMATASHQLLDDVITCVDDPHKRVQFGYVAVDFAQGTDEANCGNILSALLSTHKDPNAQPIERAQKPTGTSLRVMTPRSHRLATQLCSAVMYARSLESLTLVWAPEGHVSSRDRARLMQWITLSLFSKHARHSIQEVTLARFFVNEDDMDDVESFLMARNPLSGLCGGHEDPFDRVQGSSSSSSQIFLAKDTTLLLNPVGTRPVASRQWKSARLGRGCWAYIVVDCAGDEAHCDVLVPGYGLCRVRSSDIHSQQDVDQIQVATPNGVKRLTLELLSRQSQRTGNEYKGLCRFLHLVGAPLESLAIEMVENIAPILETMWDACVSLVQLKLREVGSDVFLRIRDAYASGRCRVSSLTVDRLQRQRGSRHMIEFLETLCDPEQLMSRTLTELSLRLDEFRVEAATADEVAAMVKMLECNTKLLFFSTSGRGSRMDEMLSSLDAYNDQPLPGQGVPLTKRTKAAFLSAIESRGDTREQGAVHALDSDVIARIYELAARPVKRKVWITD